MHWKFFASLATVLFVAGCMMYGDIDLGDDSGPYANDGECDDPRFVGAGMATSTDTDNVGKDATDCFTQLQAQNIRPVRQNANWDIAMCRAVDWGNNSSSYANDGECDDPRFTGPGMHSILLPDDAGKDAQDCRAQCEAGNIWLR